MKNGRYFVSAGGGYASNSCRWQGKCHLASGFMKNLFKVREILRCYVAMIIRFSLAWSHLKMFFIDKES